MGRIGLRKNRSGTDNVLVNQIFDGNRLPGVWKL